MGPRQFMFIMLLSIPPPNGSKQRPPLLPIECTTVSTSTWLIVTSFSSSHFPFHSAISTIISVISLLQMSYLFSLFCSGKIPSHICLISLGPLTFQLAWFLYQSKGSGLFLLNTFSCLIATMPLLPWWLLHKQPDIPCITASIHWECALYAQFWRCGTYRKY